MKILFYPIIDLKQVEEHEVTKRGSNRIYCDYQMDCLYHGFKSLFGDDLEEALQLPQWYKDVNKLTLYGNGFTIYGLINRPKKYIEDLERKIETGYYSQIIIPIHNNRYNHPDNINIVKILKAKNNNVKVICGNDFREIDLAIAEIAPFFKRELVDTHRNVYPISFAIPKEKVLKEVTEKHYFMSDMLPNYHGEAGWTITNEEIYYNKYRNSLMAETHSKGGWDSLRHYEIMMNGCVPLFINIGQCPKLTLTTLPKEFLYHLEQMYNNVSKEVFINSQVAKDYLIDCCHEILKFSAKHLTTERLAKYVLGVNNV